MTSIKKDPETVSKPTLQAEASAGSKSGQSSDCPQFEYGESLQVSVTVGDDPRHHVRIFHSKGNKNNGSRGVRMSIKRRSGVVLTSRDGVTEVNSKDLSELFGTGDQWRFLSTKAGKKDDAKDDEYWHTARHQAGDIRSSQAKLSGELFRAVVGVPSYEKKGACSLLSPEAMPRCVIESIQVMTWSMTGALDRYEEEDKTRYPMCEQTVELEVRLSKFWDEDETCCYDEETLDQGWPGTAKALLSRLQESNVRASDERVWYDPFTTPARTPPPSRCHYDRIVPVPSSASPS